MNSDSNMNNAILLRKHFSWLKGGKGYDETTVYAKEKILWDFESFICIVNLLPNQVIVC